MPQAKPSRSSRQWSQKRRLNFARYYLLRRNLFSSKPKPRMSYGLKIQNTLRSDIKKSIKVSQFILCE